MLGLPMRIPRNNWLLNCCVSPQSEIARVRVDRSLIGAPCDFRHVGHLGAGDLITSTDDGNALGALLRSKGGPEFATSVPVNLRAGDVPIRGGEKCCNIIRRPGERKGQENNSLDEKENDGNDGSQRKQRQER